MEAQIMEEIASSMATTVPMAGHGHGCPIDPNLLGSDPARAAVLSRASCTAIAGAPSLDKGVAYVSRHHSLVGGGTDLRDHSPPPVRSAPLAPASYAPQTATHSRSRPDPVGSGLTWARVD